jgi:hypothetical protein
MVYIINVFINSGALFPFYPIGIHKESYYLRKVICEPKLFYFIEMLLVFKFIIFFFIGSKKFFLTDIFYLVSSLRPR